MERYRVASSFNGNLQPKPTNMPSIPSKPHNLKDPRIAPFKPLITTTITAGRNPSHRADENELNIFDAERYFNEAHDGVKRTITIDSVANTADKDSSVSSVDGYGRFSRQGSILATPTASSVASWNSETGLLSHQNNSTAIKLRTFPSKDVPKSPSSSGRRRFGRKCPCSGRKSVDVEEKYSEPKSPVPPKLELNGSNTYKKPSSRAGDPALSSIPERGTAMEFEEEFSGDEVTTMTITPGKWAKDKPFFEEFTPEIGRRILHTTARPFGEPDAFTFPVLNQQKSSKILDDPPRDSIEVFQPQEEPSPAVVRKSVEVQRRAAVLPFSTDNYRTNFNFPASPKIRPDDDAASDTSSDLFEIESFTASQATYRRRDSLDELDTRRFVGNGAAAGILQFRRSLEETVMPSIAPSECYAPSEVSVEWSVTTAEGFDRASVANFSSAASNYGEFQFIQAEHDRFAAAMGGAANSGRRKSGGLLSCRCEKAVSVGPNPIRFNSPGELDQHLKMAKLSNGSLTRSHSARFNRPVHTR